MTSDLQDIRVVCIYCGQEFIMKNPQLFVEKMDEAARIISKVMGKDMYEIAPEAYEMNNMPNIRRQLEEKGHIRMMCMACHAISSWSIQLRGEQ